MDTGSDKIPDPDPLEPTGQLPSSRTRAWALAFAIIGVIIILVLATGLMRDSEPDQPAPDEQPITKPVAE